MIKIELTADEHEFLIHALLEKLEELRSFESKFKRLSPEAKNDIAKIEAKLYQLYQKVVQAE
jgi:hypothetical protein